MAAQQYHHRSSDASSKQQDAPKRRRTRGKPPTGFLARLEHFTWANFTFPMSTGGLALILAEQTQGYTFHGLQTIGKVVYIFDLVIFSLICAAITYRFVKFPGTLRASITHPTEGLFLSTSTLSLASIIAGMARYGIPAAGVGPWLVRAYMVLFWVYFALTFCIAVGQYVLLFTSAQLKIQDMTPAWDLPIFPFMLSGTIAAVGASLQPAWSALPMIIGGLTAQGLGMLVSVLMYANYVRRMIQYGFPSANSRPGMFIAVGPPAFTSLALMGMASAYPEHHAYFGADALTVQILRVIATMTSVFIWSLSLWFFCIAVLANLAVWRQLSFRLNWYAFVFPNVGFTITVILIGKAFDSRAVKAVGSAMTILIVATWIFVVCCHARAVWRHDIMEDGKDEDVYADETDHRHVKPGGHDPEKQA
ncbi:Uu.00g100330.m01.CDS01 [Anthostomella pinea]|uniref:Uu.00g100330.m01.CDS01 n=1 Tax=Anthostomella pinea TaxID=933095 RepID=A0AAI8YFF6_9PEZI|nr:Uu.00g100330.m01.CDS01 [Anthostomella pinea]